MKPQILFLAHRIPYPPNRGDKMRSWHLIRHLGRFATVHLAAFADDEADAAHLPALREAMGGALGEAFVDPIRRNRFAWAARALVRREPLAVTAFHGRAMQRFVARIIAERPIAAAVGFSVQMAQFVPANRRFPFVMDFCDFDSAKYAQYSATGLLRDLVFKREAVRLLAFEKKAATHADVGLFVSDVEVDLFRKAGAPAGADLRTLANGIDMDFYDAAAGFARLAPAPDGPLIVFTGQMDYRPNVDAVVGFALDVLPRVHAVRPDVRFAIVGRKPVPAVTELADLDGVIVTGEVDDVRPWLAAAALVVTPLKVARGVQNKVLEAMAMARPVVASTGAFLGIDAEPGRDLIVADGPEAQAEAVLGLLADEGRAREIGRAARRRMEDGYSWDAQLAPLAAMLGLAGRRDAA
ncbi:MAG TPA: TIGR03087 family PEP-CTERM/XrtA system glycosyltransferase [Allosphingosinicella sp.]|nr:TIGR03087 family PEP-CTERM/XrtA system glycosyltransferase [Allosphingosinicella sp.]